MKADILDQIVAYKHTELVQQKAAVPVNVLYNQVEAALQDGMRPTLSMREALSMAPPSVPVGDYKSPQTAIRTGIIAEFKRKSPSKGWINQDADVETVTHAYIEAGAAALSILTDSHFFGGGMQLISRIRRGVGVPILRKDFIIDEYQLYQARMMGADAVLLIAACLGREQCRLLASKAHELGLETLLEIHSEGELDYITDDVDMVGVNNRNLGTFDTDVQNSFRLAGLLPKDRVLVSESGISDTRTIQGLREVGFRGFLIGEAFMKTGDPGGALRKLTVDS